MWLSQEYLTPSKSEPPLEAGEAPCEFVGEEVQRLSVVQNLPQLLEGNEQLCMQRVVPRVQLALPNASTEFHMAASSTFKTILEKKLVHPRTFTQTFLQSILSSIDSRDPVVANAWVETLLDVIDLLPADVVKSDILPIAVNKGQISQKLNTRITACKLLGKISTRVDQQTLKKDTLPIVLSLCQDVKAEVRACICSQLPFVAQGLGAEGVKPSILPLLVELASDEESTVRLSSVEAIVCMLPHLQQDTMKNIIVPLVKKMCESSIRNEDLVMVVLAQVFGELCLGLEASLTLPEKRWLLNYYQQLAELGLRVSDRDFGAMRKNMPDLVPMSNNADKFVECRHHCAFHFPAMTRFCTSTSDNFEEQLYPVFCGLACDPYFEVRRTIACGLHEVTRVLGNNNGIVKSELVKLLRDDSEEVLSGLIPNLSKTLILMTKSGTINPDFMDTATLEIGRALLKCESEVSVTNNWRLHELLVQQLECLHMVLPSEFIHSYFTPVLFTRIHHARQVPVRLAATNTLLVFLRYNMKNLQRNDIRSRIISELCNGHSCYSRLAFMRLCTQALELFSKKYFKEHFYLPVLERAEDPVPNIRLIFVKLLPKLKICLRMPSDKKYFAALEASIRKIISVEKDKDVLAVLDKALTALDKIECTLDTAHVTAHSTKDDLDDHKKLEEETRLSLAAAKHGEGKQTLSPVVVPSAPMTAAGASNRQNASSLLKSQQTRYGQPSSSVSNAGIPEPTNQKRATSPAGSRSNSLQRGDPSVASSRSSSIPTGSGVGVRSSPQTYPDINPTRRNTSKIMLQPSGTPKDKDLFQSLEDEFYRDAGIKIPQQFTSSALPLRVPHTRETLYKNRHASGYGDADTESRCEAVARKERENTDVKARRCPAGGESSVAFSKAAHGGTNSQKAFGSKLAMPKKSFSSVVEKASAMTIVNRRHSYLSGEKMPKSNPRVEEKDGPQKRVTSVMDNSRRHSYIERLQISTQGDETKSDSSLATNQSKRQSFHAKEEHNYRSPTSQATKPAIPLRKNLSRALQSTEPKSDTTNRRRSLNFTHTEKTQRNPSSRAEKTDFSDNLVKRRSLIAPAAVSKFCPNRRHSSLERDDVDRAYGPGYVNRRSSSPRVSKEDLQPADESLYKTKLRRPGFVFKNEAAQIDFTIQIEFVTQNRLAKIPHSNNSSPGNSRSSSPLGVPNRSRHLTAPSSRAGSPTATLRGYLSSLKLTEPSSKLPIRKK